MQVSHNNISKATKDPVNPENQSHGAQHPTKRWPYCVGAAPGPHRPHMGSLIYKSFLCESISHQGSGRRKKKTFHTILVSLESPFSPETQNMTCSHFGKYSGARLKTISQLFVWCVAQSSGSRVWSLKTCPADCAKADTFTEGSTREALLHICRFLWKQSNLGNKRQTWAWPHCRTGNALTDERQ